jgi:hypothetical protein
VYEAFDVSPEEWSNQLDGAIHAWRESRANNSTLPVNEAWDGCTALVTDTSYFPRRRCSLRANCELGGQRWCNTHYRMILRSAAVERFFQRLYRLWMHRNEQMRQKAMRKIQAKEDRIIAARENAVVYYAEVGGGNIKIGTTVNLKMRQESLYMNVLVTEPGSYDVEHERHEQFAEERIRGELFRPSDRLMRHIKKLSGGPQYT